MRGTVVSKTRGCRAPDIDAETLETLSDSPWSPAGPTEECFF